MNSIGTLLTKSQHWTDTTLGKIVEYITSGSRDWSKYYSDSGAIFIRTQDINQNRLSLEEVAYVKLPQKVEGKRSLVRKGDLLITITGANVGKIAVVDTEIPEAYVSQSVCLVRLKDPSTAKFIHLQLITRRGEKTAVEGMAYGLGRPVLNLENIRSAPVRLAPSHIQTTIVAEIEKQFSRLDEAVASLKRTKANLKRCKAAVLKAAVEGKLTEDWRKQHPDVEPANKLLERILAEHQAKWSGRGEYKEPSGPSISDLPHLPDRWTWVTMPQLGELNRGKSKHRPRNDPKLFGGPYPFIQTGDVKHSGGFVRSHSQTYNQFGLAQSRLWPAGTLCITIAANIAETGILTYPACFPDSVVGFVFDGAPETVRFIDLFFRTEREEIARFAPATAQKNINLEILSEVAIPFPALGEQKEIVAEVERRLSLIDELEAAVETNLIRADRLKQSILGQAFSGELIQQ